MNNYAGTGDPPKKSYSPPVLTFFGDLASITKSGAGTKPEGGVQQACDGVSTKYGCP